MAAFNVSVLPDFGYPETTKFIDPMEQRWRSKEWDDAKFTEDYVKGTLLPMFSGLDAYDKADEIEHELEEYWKKKET